MTRLYPHPPRALRAALAIALLTAACQNLPAAVAPGAGSTVTVTVRPGFRTQAALANVHHFAVSLRNTATFVTLKRHATVNNAVTNVTFQNVPPGTYVAAVEAFEDAGELANVTMPDKQPNATVTVALGSSPVYTPGPSSLAATVKMVNEGAMASDDVGNSRQFHAYTYTHNAVTNQFVWVPTFTAYQLVNPANCGTRQRFGTADNARPAGYWVASTPDAGQPGQDWRDASFGGFYVGKYEASHEDATGAAAGTSPDLSVRQSVVPWTGINWGQAAVTCLSFSPACRLMGDDEWTALAVYAQINDLTVKGNNSSGTAIEGGATISGDDPTDNGATPGRCLTGAGDTSTALPNTATGVADLNGNVMEWTANVSFGVSNYVIDDVTGASPAFPAGTNKIATLTTAMLQDAALFGLPGTLNASGCAEFGYDVLTAPGGTGDRNRRGGDWTAGLGAGLWSMAPAAPITANANTGFRPILRF